MYTEKCKLNKTASWPEPVANDNSGTVHMKYPQSRPPVNLAVGIHNMFYSATDESGNTMNCSFLVQVQGTSI